MQTLHVPQRCAPPPCDVDRRVDVGVSGVATSDKDEARLALAAPRIHHTARRAGLRHEPRGHTDHLTAALRHLVGQDRREPQPAFRITRFSPAFWRTFRPGLATVPFAPAVMLRVFRSSSAATPQCLAMSNARARVGTALGEALYTRRGQGSRGDASGLYLAIGKCAYERQQASQCKGIAIERSCWAASTPPTTRVGCGCLAGSHPSWCCASISGESPP